MYFSDKQVERIKAQARRDLFPYDLWSFLHSLISFAMLPENCDLSAVVEWKRDGVFQGVLWTREFAELIEIALNERADAVRAAPHMEMG